MENILTLQASPNKKTIVTVEGPQDVLLSPHDPRFIEEAGCENCPLKVDICVALEKQREYPSKLEHYAAANCNNQYGRKFKLN